MYLTSNGENWTQIVDSFDAKHRKKQTVKKEKSGKLPRKHKAS